MSPERDDPTDDQDLYEDVPPRSIFAATWFRVVLVLIVLGVFGAVAVPYVLDWMNPPPVSRSASVKATSPVPQPAPIAPLPASESAASSSAPSSSSTSSSSGTSSSSSAEKSASMEKKDAPLAPTATPAPPPTLAKPEPKPEPKPAPAAKPAAPKTEAKSTAPADTSAKSAMTESAKAPAAAKTESAPKSQVVAKAEPAKDETKSAAATTPPATKRAAAKATSTNSKAPVAFWVQVGAFRDAETAKRVATALRDQSYKVEESNTQVSGKAAAAASSAAAAPSPAASPGDLYDVYVSGMSAVELTKRLSAKGLAAETSGGSVVVKPSLPLRDAVTLSKDLAVDGLKVQVRRAGSGASGPVAVAPALPATPGETLHRVRVGAFTDVAEARAAAKELEGKGYKPFIARGDQ